MPPRLASHPARRPARRRFTRAAAVVGAALVAAACNDPITQQAALDVSADTLVVVALTGSAPNARSALLLRTTPTAVAPEAVSDADIHVALDIDAQGRPVVYPGALVSRIVPRRAGVRRVTAVYDSLQRAPTDGYSADSALTVAVGEVVGVRLPGAAAECQFTGRPYFYSKLVVDSVRLQGRLLFVRATTNPNCGFRSFAPGLPRD